MQQNNQQESLMDTLEKMGYIAKFVYDTVDDSMIALKNRNNQNIGNIDTNGGINLYTAHEWERDKIEKGMEFSELFHSHKRTPYNAVNLLTHNNVMLTADFDRKTGDIYYNVLPEKYTAKDIQEAHPFQNIENAKRTFAVEAGFTNDTLHSKDYVEALQNKLSSLLKKHGYEVQFGVIASEAMSISLDDDMLATLDDNFGLNLKTTNPKIAGLLESLHEQATWETRNDFEYSPTLMRRIADALIRMSYDVKHTFENLSVKMGIFKGDKVADFDGTGKVIFEENTPASIREEIGQIYKNEFARLQSEIEELRTQLAGNIIQENANDFSRPISQATLDEIAEEEMLYQMHEDLQESAIRRTEQEGISSFEKQARQNQDNPAHEDFKDTGETTSQLSRQEAVLIATLLKTGDCRALTEKYNCRHAVDTLIKKIDKEYPDLNLPTNELPHREEMKDSRPVTHDYGEPDFEQEP